MNDRENEVRSLYCNTDPCVYVRHKTGNIEIITVWVDDLLLFTNMPDIMRHLKVELQNLFEITNMGEPSKIVGIEIEHDHENKTISIRQAQYINLILQKWGMNKANKVAMPIDPHLKLEPSINNTPSKSTPYASLIRLLMYATMATYPDIAYTVSQLTAFMTNPDLQHWTAAKHVLRYLAGMQNLCICLWTCTCDTP